MASSRRAVGILACTQILSWGSLYYAFSILAPGVQRELGWSTTLVYGAYSWSLLVAGLAATPIGILLDRHGGRLVMGAGSIACAAGLFALGASRSPAAWIAAWTLLGLAMGLSLYEAAFATLNRRLGAAARPAISNLTLFAGFASTIFWPLTGALEAAVGWRATYCWFGAAQLAICLPLHLLLGAEPAGQQGCAPAARSGHTLAEALRHPAFWKLALAFSANVFVFAALSVHLIPLLRALGHGSGAAVGAAMLVGPMQVAGRLLERTVGRDTAPQLIGKYCFAALPAALAVLLLFGSQAWAIACFCIVYGLGNGVLTIVRGTLPQAMFGSAHYGAIAGALAGPSLLAKASGPIVAAWVLEGGATPAVLLATLFGVALAAVAMYAAAVAGSGRRAAPLISR